MSASDLLYLIALNLISLGLTSFDLLVCDDIFGVFLLVVECVLLLFVVVACCCLLLLLLFSLLFVFKMIVLTKIVSSYTTEQSSL